MSRITMRCDKTRGYVTRSGYPRARDPRHVWNEPSRAFFTDGSFRGFQSRQTMEEQAQNVLAWRPYGEHPNELIRTPSAHRCCTSRSYFCPLQNTPVGVCPRGFTRGACHERKMKRAVSNDARRRTTDARRRTTDARRRTTDARRPSKHSDPSS